MKAFGSIEIGGLRISRLAQHILFWMAVWVAMVIIYGANKPHVVVARVNFFYLPVHIAYFYTLAYGVIPAFLLRGRLWMFVLYAGLLVVVATYLCRIVDVAFVDPYEIAAMGKEWVWYPPEDVTFWDKVVDPTYVVGAFKGINLVVWLGVAIKLFKMWVERKNAALEAELNFLKTQVHPHFLFNTLNNLYSLSLQSSPKAPGMILKLSDMMRYMLYECDVVETTLEKDLQMLHEYIALERMRYDDRLDFSFSVNGEIAGWAVPPLLLLPLVENAFKHGARELAGEVWISADLSVSGNILKFKVSNSKPADVERPKSSVGCIGLSNLQKRLELLYNGAAELRVYNEEDLFLAVLELPLAKSLN